MQFFTSSKLRMSFSTSRKLAITAVAAALLITGTACKKSQVDPFPKSGAVSGWQKTADTRTFAAKDLWQYIDGGAEQYVKAGVISAVTSDYRYQDHLEAVADVYTMGDATGAHKIFAGEQTKDGKSIALGDEAIAYGQSVVFRKGVYVIRVVAFEAAPEADRALLDLAHAIEAKL